MNRPISESQQVYLYGRVARKEEQSSTDHLGEFDRFRTCDHQIHILTLYLLSYKLQVVAPDGFEPRLTDSKSAVLTITPWGNVVRKVGFEPTKSKDNGFTVRPR